jgi:hypothetical protein
MIMMNYNRWLQFAMIGSFLLLCTRPTRAQEEVQVKPWFLVIVDTSGSMNPFPGPPYSEADRPKYSSDLGANSCGHVNNYPNYRIGHARCALNRLVNSTGDAVFGLMRFNETSSFQECTVAMGCDNNDAGHYNEANATNKALMQVGIAEGNQSSILNYVNDSGSCYTNELVAPYGQGTPLNSSMRLARDYLRGAGPSGFSTSPIASDPYAGCRPVSVIMLTDGGGAPYTTSLCGASPAETAQDLWDNGITLASTPNGQQTIHVRTYVIGFGKSVGDQYIESYADAGGTTAFYAQNESDLSVAFSDIVAEGQLRERCNGQDDDCDGQTDEGFNVGTDCSIGVGACYQEGTIQCKNPITNPYETVCYTGASPISPGSESSPVTNCKDTIDNDCDGVTDCSDGDCANLPICDCVPQAEICDKLDNDCDGSILDEAGITQPCGTDVGECDFGIKTCTPNDPSNLWSSCVGGTGPTTEVCDNLDNDCDGVTDENLSQPCPAEINPTFTDVGECDRGWQVCVAGAWTPNNACTGAVGPSSEVCDNLDNDCDGATDEDLSQPCQSACGQGVQACVAGQWGDCSIGKGTAEVCNNVDDDCDGTTDEDIEGEGDPCGSSAGACTPGIRRCINGAWVCEGGTDLSDEVCDGKDNDCDGVIDDGLGLGDVCGTDEGECKSGREQCIKAAWVCVGAIGPSKEICDCKDNDCDGLTDEETEGSLCPGDSICMDCRCALPCGQSVEFKDMCPSEKVAYHPTENECYCVGEACQADKCATETVTSSGETECDPNSHTVGVCVCKNNKCTFPCDGVTCASGLVCDPHDGICKDDSCVIFGCEQDQRCDPVLKACETDPCSSIECAADQVCRDGSCFKSCASVTCETGSRCVEGECKEDKCATVQCGAPEQCNQDTGECQTNVCLARSIKCQEGLVCDAFSGECIADPCLKLNCPAGESCQDGTCVFRCASGKIECGHSCVDPQSSLEYCGATLDCQGSNAGVECSSGKVCASGKCADECPKGQIKCDGICADPASNTDFCGATGDCQGDHAGKKCDEGQVCSRKVCALGCDNGLINCGGVCVNGQSDSAYCGATGNCSASAAGRKCAADESCQKGECAASGSAQPDSGIKNGITAVTAAGGGGCACTVTPGGGAADSAHWAWAFVLFVIGRWRVRKKGIPERMLRRIHELACTFAIAGAVMGAGTLLTGCRVSTFCFDCQEKGQARDSGARPDSGNDQTGKDSAIGAADGEVAETDGQIETTDGEVTDGQSGSDGAVDCADANLESDPKNCGACGHACVIAHAFVECVAGTCQMSRCDVGFMDLDQDPSTGCEYECLPSADDDSTCNRSDDDCDGLTDEDVDMQNDAKNCGKCGSECLFAHAPNGGSCQNGLCFLDPTQCESGFHDVDGAEENGCEYECDLSNPPYETCNLLDDDCDGLIDETQAEDKNNNNVTIADGWIGQSCKTDVGECISGAKYCIGGREVCSGFVGPSREICDAKDNDCDGQTDNGFYFGTDPNNCGECGHVCSAPHAAVNTCTGGVCSIGSCETNWWGSDCSHNCVYTGTEVCDGKDNDCDQATDEGLTQPTAPCKSAGVCGNGSGQPRITTRTCRGASGWVCDYSSISTYEAVETSFCDGLDNDCNGVVDDPASPSNRIGQSCSVPGTGDSALCRAFGVWKCVGSALTCVDGVNNPIPAPVKGQEICDGLDNNCDGIVDNSPINDPSHCANPTVSSVNCVRDAWALISGSTTYIYKYEASRSDATKTSSGNSTSRACSTKEKLPWTNVTHGQAATACANAGGRLCTEAEWEAACRSSGSCSWSYASSCGTYNGNTCNGLDYDTNSATAGNQDAILPTGSMANCYRTHNSENVYDLSGNVKEWIQASRAGVNPLRGGAMNNLGDGIRCDFDFTFADDEYFLFNAGFRCCYGP